MRKIQALLIVALSWAMHLPARASDDGKLCDGAGALGCGPRFLQMAVAEKLRRKPPAEKVRYAIADGDLPQVQAFDPNDDPAYQAHNMLPVAVHEYMTGISTGKDAERLAIIEYLLGKADVTGDLGPRLLQETIYQASFIHMAAEKTWPRRLALARLLVDHGASAKGVNLAGCYQCEAGNELLPLLLEHGARAEKTAVGQSNLLK